jgi:superfamily II DNA or RNA helicase
MELQHAEIQETKAPDLPPASVEMLQRMREEACSSSSFAFKLQPQQRFLRRVLSPDAPTQNMLVVHGVGSGKSCSAIQVAEEYILRPEFQDKKVLILANPSIQDNFKTQLFDVSRVHVENGVLMSKQCSGRRYLDMLQRGQRQPLKVSTQEDRELIMSRASKLIKEFYEFQGYGSFAKSLDAVQSKSTPHDFDAWIHATFDNRLILVDEAHNLRGDTSETVDSKFVSEAIKRVVQTADNITLVLLTATPMYDVFEEIFDYFNLFLWNARKQGPSSAIHARDFFTQDGEFVEGKESEFRGLCESYVSFVRGENPFTFPFRLPPPDELIPPPDRTTDCDGNPITTPLRYLTLTQSVVSPEQEAILRGAGVRSLSDSRTICTYPGTFTEAFEKRGEQYFYRDTSFLDPDHVATYSSKFALIVDILKKSEGLVFVYSNLVEQGVQLLAMCLEEHGYTSATGDTLLGNPSGKPGAGKYALITSKQTDADLNRLLARIRRPENKNGKDVRVILAGPKVSEGVDFRYVRQIHILDPWFNMSRIEQVVGRGMRVCSHALLPFEEQNTTVYLHVCRYATEKRECLDETIYRAFVEKKGAAIAKVRQVIAESAMDCALEHSVNALPAEWRTLKVPQKRNEDGETLHLTIEEMSSPTFLETSGLKCHNKSTFTQAYAKKLRKRLETESAQDIADDEGVDVSAIENLLHERPLSAIMDVRDELLDKILSMIARKPVWTFKDVYASPEMKNYEPELVSYLLQHLIEAKVPVKSLGRTGVLQATKGLLSFSQHEGETLQDKYLVAPEYVPAPLDAPAPVPAPAPVQEKKEHKWPKELKLDHYSEEVKQWVYMDTVMSHADKVAHILAGVEAPYATPLWTEDGTMALFAPDEVYKGEKIEPIGEDKDAVDAWIEALKQKYLANKDKLFASLKDGKIVFNLADDVPVRKVDRSKGIGGKACTSYPVPILKEFMKWVGVDDNPKTKTLTCDTLQFAVRQAVLDGKDIVWYTPEEWLFLDKIKTQLK